MFSWKNIPVTLAIATFSFLALNADAPKSKYLMIGKEFPSKKQPQRAYTAAPAPKKQPKAKPIVVPCYDEPRCTCKPQCTCPPPCKPVCCKPVCCKPPPCRVPRPRCCPPPCEVPCYYDDDWYGSFDFLWWQGNTGSINAITALEGTIDTGGTIDTLIIDLVLDEYDFKWRPGFRLGVGHYLIGMDNWDFFGNWTWFHDVGKGKVLSDISIPSLFTLSTNASASWKLNYNVFDLEFGRNFLICDRFDIRPHFGFRGAIIDQKYAARVPSIDFSAFGITGMLSAKAQNEFTGAGIRGGARLIWELNPHLGILGQFAGSVILGEFDLNATTNTDVTIDIGATADFRGSAKTAGTFFKARTNLEGLFGLYSKWPIYCDQQLLEFTLGYETAVWFKQNELNAFVASSTSVLDLISGSLAGLSTIPLFGTSARHLAVRGLTFNVRYSF